jgi:Uma2 family endonuclease
VVSGSQDDRDRDYIVKRAEYAEAAISEYWVIDPDEERVTVLELRDGSYVEHAFRRGQIARSVSFTDLAIAVSDLLDAD